MSDKNGCLGLVFLLAAAMAFVWTSGPAARADADRLAGALRDVQMLAGVSWDGDPWYAQQANIEDPQGILDRALAAHEGGQR
jgi:hypothetical protein